MDAVEHALEGGVRDPLPQDVERLDERHPRLEEGRQLLVEDEKFLATNPPPSRPATPQPGQAAATVQGKDEQALFLELPPQAGLVVGHVNAFDDLAAGRAQPTAEFHRPSVA